jgi:hypothetical protein
MENLKTKAFATLNPTRNLYRDVIMNNDTVSMRVAYTACPGYILLLSINHVLMKKLGSPDWVNEHNLNLLNMVR